MARGAESASLAKKLGASVYIDNKLTNAAEELQKLGGAQIIVSTLTSAKALEWALDGLVRSIGKEVKRGATILARE